MRLFPRYWEGTHDAFPKQDVTQAGFLTEVCTYGTVVGLTVASISAFVGLAKPGTAIRCMGVVGILSSGYASANEAFKYAAVKRDVYPLLKAEGMPLPRFKFWERTASWTSDDYVLVGCGVGLLRGLLPARFGAKHLPIGYPNLTARSRPFRTIGCAFAGGGLVSFLSISRELEAQSHQETESARLKSQQMLENAKTLYETKTGKIPPEWLYGSPPSSAIEMLNAQHIASNLQDTASILFSGEDERSEQRDALALALHTPREDIPSSYYWEPENKEAGIRILETQLDVLYQSVGMFLLDIRFLENELFKMEGKPTEGHAVDDVELPAAPLRAKQELVAKVQQEMHLQMAEAKCLISNLEGKLRRLKGIDGEPPQDLDFSSYRPDRVVRFMMNAHAEAEMLVQGIGELSHTDDSDEMKKYFERHERYCKEEAAAAHELLDGYMKLYSPDELSIEQEVD